MSYIRYYDTCLLLKKNDLSHTNRTLLLNINAPLSLGSNNAIVFREVSDPGNGLVEADDDAIRRTKESCCIRVACLSEASRYNYG